jgi:hypothetical protein
LELLTNNGGKDLFIFGCGFIGQQLYDEITAAGASNVRFIDNQAGGKTYHGAEILLPEAAFTQYPQALFVVGSELYSGAMAAQLRAIGVPEENIVVDITRVKHSLRLRPQTRLAQIDYHLVEHCNLKCAGCLHFSNLAEASFASLKIFVQDLERLAVLLGDQLDRIILLGGEPLLHPQVGSFFPAAMEIFPHTPVTLVTNGLLLTRMPEHFWQSCARSQVQIVISKYPLDIQIGKIREIAGGYGVGIVYSARDERQWEQHVFDFLGGQDPADSFLRCPQANKCCQLKKGKLYPCSITAGIEHFNAAFVRQLLLSASDTLDIFAADNAREIFAFLSQPPPFCRYCQMRKRKYSQQWRRSGREIGEYLE